MRLVVGMVAVAAVFPASAAAFGDGIHAVGQDISPGTYRAEGGDNCYWARLSGFGGTVDEIISNGNPDGPIMVRILPSDAGFETDGCGEWMVPIPVTAPTPSPTITTVPPDTTTTMPLDLFLEGMGHHIGTLADGMGSARGFIAFADRWTDDVAAYLLTVRYDPCYADLYRESWELVGRVAAIAALADGSRTWRRAFPAIVDDVLPVDDFQAAWGAATC
jgi:hypothetical protein